MVRSLDKKGFEEALRTSGKPVVVDFTAGWCPYCQKLAPVIEGIAAEYQDKADVYFVDTDNQPELAERYDVMTIPTVFVFENGKVRDSAVNPGTKQALLKLIFKGEA